MSEDGVREMRIPCVKSDQYRDVYSSGAYGGITPQGDIQAQFFIDRLAPPEHLMLGAPDSSLSRAHNESPFLREAQVGVLMRPDIARSVGLWLLRVSDEARKLIEERDQGGEVDDDR